MTMYFLLIGVNDKKAVENIDKASNVIPFISVILVFQRTEKLSLKLVKRILKFVNYQSDTKNILLV
ncbi:hypothetical protein KCF3NO3_06080 [Chryseobacterium sp. KCF3-3]